MRVSPDGGELMTRRVFPHNLALEAGRRHELRSSFLRIDRNREESSMPHFIKLIVLTALLAPAATMRCESAGVYAAKWRRVDGAWLLEAELFATEACGGDFCPAAEDPAP
jgi:hypothetical protein